MTRLALVRVPREFCSTIRTSLTLLTEIKNQRIAISILSVNGSARTAKINSIRTLQYYYRELLSKVLKNNSSKNVTIKRKELDQICQSMEEVLEVISNIDY
jgi:Rpp14/Pop5 family